MSRFVRRLLAGVAALGLGVAASLAVAAPAAADAYFRLKSFNGDNKCLAIGGASTANGVDAIQWTCTSFGILVHPEQYWYWSSGRLRNYHSKKCLAIGGASEANGAHVIQWPCSSGPEQQWDLSASFLWNGNSNKVMAVGGASTANGAVVIQWPYSGGDEQAWSVEG